MKAVHLPDGTKVTVFEPNGDQESKLYQFADGTYIWSGIIPDSHLPNEPRGRSFYHSVVKPFLIIFAVVLAMKWVGIL